MFVVFGASGNTGSVVARTLLERGKTVRVVARDVSRVEPLVRAGAEAFAGDVLDAASVARALAGAEAAYFLIPPDAKSLSFVARSRKVAENFAAAVAKSSLRHGVLLSSVGAHVPEGTGPIVTVHVAESLLRATNVPFTFVRAAYFMDNLLGFASPIKNDGVLPVFGGGESHPFPMVATRDIGKVAAEELLAPAQRTEVVELSGPKEYSYVDAATEASKIVGRPVQATPLPLDAIVPTMKSLGASDDFAGLYREMIAYFGSGKAGFERSGRTARGTTELADVLRALA